MIPIELPRPTIGRIVVFTHDDNSASRAGGNVEAGTQCPAVVVRVWNEETGYVNLKVINDSNYDTWETSIIYGDGQRQWTWPVISPSSSIALRLIPAEQAII